MRSTAILKKITKLSRNQKIHLYDNFDSLFDIIKIAQSSEETISKLNVSLKKSTLTRWLYQNVGNEINEIKNIINSSSFNKEHYLALIEIAADEETYDDLVDAIVISLLQEEETKQAVISGYDKILNIALNSADPDFAEALTKYLPDFKEGISPIEQWHQKNQQTDGKERDVPPRKKLDPTKIQRDLDNLIEETSSDTLVRFLNIHYPNNEEIGVRKIINSEDFDGKNYQKLLNIATNPNSSEQLVNSVVFGLLKEEKTNSFVAQNLDSFIDLAAKSETDAFAEALSRAIPNAPVSPLEIRRQRRNKTESVPTEPRQRTEIVPKPVAPIPPKAEPTIPIQPDVPLNVDDEDTGVLDDEPVEIPPVSQPASKIPVPEQELEQRDFLQGIPDISKVQTEKEEPIKEEPIEEEPIEEEPVEEQDLYSDPVIEMARILVKEKRKELETYISLAEYKGKSPSRLISRQNIQEQKEAEENVFNVAKEIVAKSGLDVDPGAVVSKAIEILTIKDSDPGEEILEGPKTGNFSQIINDLIMQESFTPLSINETFGGRAKISINSNEIVLGNMLRIPIVKKEDGSFKLGIKTGLLSNTFDHFSKINKENLSEADIQKQIQHMFFGPSYESEMEEIANEYKKVRSKKGQEPGAHKEALETYRFYTGMQADILGIFHKYDLFQILAPPAVDFILDVITKEKSKPFDNKPIERTSSLFDASMINEIIRMNTESEMGTLNRDQVIEIIDTKFPTDMVEYYHQGREYNQQYALQGELLSIKGNKGARRLSHFCLTCGRFRQGGYIPKNGLGERNKRFFYEDNKVEPGQLGCIRWKGAVPSSDADPSYLEEWKNNDPIPAEYEDSKNTFQVSDFERSFLSDEANKAIDHKCILDFDEDGQPILQCKIIPNHHKKPINKSVPIVERMGYSHTLKLNGKNLKVFFSEEKEEKGEGEEIWIGKHYNDFFGYCVEDLKNNDLNGTGDGMVNVPGMGRITVEDLIERFIVRSAKHSYSSFMENIKRIQLFSEGNGEKVNNNGEISTKTDLDVIRECSPILIELFTNIERNKPGNENLSESEIYTDGLMRFMSFKFSPIPSTSFLQTASHPGESVKGVESKEYFPHEEEFAWSQFLGRFGIVGDAAIDVIVSDPKFFSRINYKRIKESIDYHLNSLIIDSELYDFDPDEKAQLENSIVQGVLADAFVGFPEHPKGDESFSQKIRDAEATFKSALRSGKGTEKWNIIKKKIIQEHIVQTRTIADEANDNQDLLEAWNLRGVNLDDESLAKVTRMILNQLYSTVSDDKPVKPLKDLSDPNNKQPGSSGRLGPVLIEVLKEGGLTSFLEPDEDRELQPAARKTLQMVREGIIASQNEISEIDKEIRGIKDEDEQNSTLLTRWKALLSGKVFEEFSKNYNNVDQDKFFDILNASIDTKLSRIRKLRKRNYSEGEEYLILSEEMNIPEPVLRLMQIEHNFVRETMYDSEEVKNVPNNVWFLKSYFEIAENLARKTGNLNAVDPDEVLAKIVERRRGFQQVREVEQLNDDATALEYIKASVQKDLKKLIHPSEWGRVVLQSETGAPVFDQLKKLSPKMQDQLNKIFIQNPDAYKTFLEDFQADIASFMPKKVTEKQIYSVPVKPGEYKDPRAANQALATTAPIDLDDFEKMSIFPKPVRKIFLELKNSGDRLFFSRRGKQLISQLCLEKFQRTTLKKGGDIKNPKDYQSASKDIVESGLVTLISNAFRGQLPMASQHPASTPAPFEGEDLMGRKSMEYYYLIDSVDKIKEHLGINLEMPLMMPSLVKPKKAEKINWYKASMKNKEPIPQNALFEAEAKKFNWYKNAKLKDKSSYELVLVCSNPDLQIMYNNICNNSRGIGSLMIPFFSIVPFEDFGSLYNILDFNKKSFLIARAITRKEADIFRKMKLIE